MPRRFERVVLVACIVLIETSSGGAQFTGVVDPLEPLAFMVGHWEGTFEGQPGSGTLQREYTRVLNSKFIREQNRTVYPPQDKNPKGEIHEHFSVISFDKSRRRAVLRQFHVEGFVNQEHHQLALPSKPFENPAAVGRLTSHFAHA